MIGKAIYAKLTGVGSQTGAVLSTRVYPELSPGLVCPLVVYEVQGGDLGSLYSGGSDLRSANVALSCIAETYAGAQSLSEKVITDMHEQRGTWGNVIVQGAFIKDKSEDSVRLPEMGADQVYYVVTLDCLCWYEV